MLSDWVNKKTRGNNFDYHLQAKLDEELATRMLEYMREHNLTKSEAARELIKIGLDNV